MKNDKKQKQRNNKGEHGEKKNLSTFALCRFVFPRVFRRAPVITTIILLVPIYYSLTSGFSTVITEKLVAGAERFAADGVLTGVLVALAWSFGLAVLSRLMPVFQNILWLRFGHKVEVGFFRDALEKIAVTEPISFTNTESLDEMDKALQGMNNIYNLPFQISELFTYSIPYFIFMSIYLWLMYPPLVLSLFLVFIPALFGNLLKRKIATDLEEQIAPFRRSFGYYESTIVGRDLYKENRILGNYRLLRGRHLMTLRKMQGPQKKEYMKGKRLNLTLDICSYGGYTAVLLLLFYALLWGHIGVAQFSAVFLSIGNLYGAMNNMISIRLGDIASDNATMSNYVRFVQTPSVRGNETTPPAPTDITFDNVSFQYPQTEVPALQHISFTLKKGETLAIVGENGAGKSTLIRLLSGLYLPQSGDVTYGGRSSVEWPLSVLTRGTSAVFQQYQKYQMTLRENVEISDWDKSMSDESMHELLVQCGLNENNGEFPNGLETMLSREFDGVDVSGGQWQRIAIARGYYRDHWLIIMDEPTAAIDPFEESRIYHMFADLAKEKTAVLVTHRLGSVRLADRILVLKNGELVQIGTHDELVNTPGEYQRLWKAQSQWYEENEETTGEAETPEDAQ